jgi:hypothetical protein
MMLTSFKLQKYFEAVFGVFRRCDVFILEETKKIFIKFTAKKSFSSVSGFDCKSR